MIVALAGGVGGSRLAQGLAQLLGPELTVIVNTGDDFRHLGLYVSPDIDTVVYMLAGIANPETGWGIAGESWNFLDQLGRLGGESWFRLGDRDLAMHVERTRRLSAGERLTTVTAALAFALGVVPRVLPMCDAPVSTIVQTADGPLAFQDYFVRLGCAVPVTGFAFAGIGQAEITAEIRTVLTDPGLDAILVCPSNPFVSVDPILGVPGMADLIRAAAVPVIAVSPIIGDKAVKGPAAKMLGELGLPVSAPGVARHYRDHGLVTGFLMDDKDRARAAEVEALGLTVETCETLMGDEKGRRRLAEACLAFAGRLRAG
jgi:LPPG:FO 2-phospho-L-lactate transferase